MFTPSDRAFAAIRRVALVTERPTSAVVAEQMEVLTEHLENLAGLLEEAKRIHQEEPQAVVAAARAAFEQMLPILGKAEGELSGVMDDLAEQLSLLDDTPPSSNTGATTPPGPPTSTRKAGGAHA